MKRKLTLFVIACFALPALALDAPGGVVYKMPNGELVKRQGTLVHTKGEKGEKDKVTLVFGDKASLDAKRIAVKKAEGRTIVAMLFVTEIPADDHHKVAMVFHGTLLKGTNGAVYYGDIFSKMVKPENLDEVYNEFQDCDGGSCGGQCEGGCKPGEEGGQCEGGCKPGEEGGQCEGGCQPGEGHHHHHKHPKHPGESDFHYTGGFGFHAKFEG